MPNEEQQAPNLLKSLSSKLRSMRSMRRSSGDQSLQLSTQMSNLGPARQEGESAGAAATHAMLLMCLVLCELLALLEVLEHQLYTMASPQHSCDIC